MIFFYKLFNIPLQNIDYLVISFTPLQASPTGPHLCYPFIITYIFLTNLSFISFKPAPIFNLSPPSSLQGCVKEMDECLWLQQWMVFAKRFALQYNPALQPRAIIVYGCISKSVSDSEVKQLLRILVKVATRDISWYFTTRSVCWFDLVDVGMHSKVIEWRCQVNVIDYGGVSVSAVVSLIICFHSYVDKWYSIVVIHLIYFFNITNSILFRNKIREVKHTYIYTV